MSELHWVNCVRRAFGGAGGLFAAAAVYAVALTSAGIVFSANVAAQGEEFGEGFQEKPIAAEPIATPFERILICPNKDGYQLVYRAAAYESATRAGAMGLDNCREQLRWDYGDRWLCSLDGVLVVSDFPAGLIGAVGADLDSAASEGKYGLCKRISAGCTARIFSAKICQPIQKAGSVWKQFGDSANVRPIAVDESCPKENTGRILLPYHQLVTGCNSERCVLEERADTWRRVAGLVDQSSAWTDFSFLELAQIQLESNAQEKLVSEPGVYCVKTKVESSGAPRAAVSAPLENEVLISAVMKQTLLSSELVPLSKAISRPFMTSISLGSQGSLVCKSDDDCVQGEGYHQCQLKILMPVRAAQKSDYVCRCLRGPTVFGCVAEAIP